jgi:hypothetical protein
MINRRVTRTVFNQTETTAQTGSLQGDLLSFPLQGEDTFCVGFHGKFSARYIVIDTPNENPSSLSVDYWNGTEWNPVTDLVDQTSLGGVSFGQSGFISWQNESDWQKSTIAGLPGVELYWIRLSPSNGFSAGTQVQAIVNLFSDDSLLRAYYPELITNTQYLPTGRTNFLDQHLAAKDLVVLRMKQRQLIDDESQIIDLNEVAIGAVHACAWLIVNPIAVSEASQSLRDSALTQFNDEMNRLNKSVDQNADGIIEDVERVSSFGMLSVVRR